ncbi:hypothetical protein KEM56_000184 [Ascosphaera pollenicola]|nr:hypothetical protein KEM56_000184 [Ascosphaera pollenicola]
MLYLEKRVAEEDEDDDAPFSMLAAAACDDLNAFTSLLRVSQNGLDMQRLRDRWIREDLMGINPMGILLNFGEEPGHDNAFHMLTLLASAGIRDGPWKLHCILTPNGQIHDVQEPSFRSVRKLAQCGALNTLMFMLQQDGPLPRFDFSFSMTKKEDLAIRMVEEEYLESQKLFDEDGKMTCDLWKRSLANILYDAALKFGQLRVLEAIFDRCPTWAREYDVKGTYQEPENASIGVALTHLGRYPDTDTTLDIIRLLH